MVITMILIMILVMSFNNNCDSIVEGDSEIRYDLILLDFLINSIGYIISLDIAMTK